MLSRPTLPQIRPIFIDLQTTGASPSFGSILEMGWGRADPQGVIQVHSQLIKTPLENIPPRIRRLTGFTDDQMAQADSDPVTLWNHWRSLWPSPLPPIVIHYARFELAFLANLGPLSLADLTVICTYEISRRLLHGLPSKSLRSVSGYLGSPLCEFKKAEDHIKATHFIWQNLLPQLAQQHINTLEQLKNWLQQPVSRHKEPKIYALDPSKRLTLTRKPGVYFLLSATKSILYIGKATNLKSRVNSYFRGQKTKGSRLNELVSQVADIEVIVQPSALAAAMIESDLIKKHDPPYNRALRTRESSIGGWNASFQSQNEYLPGCYGPIRSQRFTRYVESIVQALCQQKPLILEAAEIDDEIVGQGLALFRQQWQIEDNMDRQRLLRLGIYFWRQKVLWLQDQARLALEEANGPLPEQESEVELDTPREWDKEDVARHLRSVLTRAGFQIHRSRWLRRLCHCHVIYQEAGGQSFHHVAMNDGQPKFHRIQSSRPIGEYLQSLSLRLREQCHNLPRFDLEQYDRIMVLYSEMRRWLKSGSEVYLKYHEVSTRCPYLDRSDLFKYVFPEDHLD